MDTPKKSKISDEKFAHYLDWRHIVFAVLDVILENRIREEENDTVLESRSDFWACNDRLREDVRQRACQFWCERTGLDHTWFAYSHDAVSRLYLRFRKRNKDEIADFRYRFDNASSSGAQLTFDDMD